jgi:regulator of cell morphogenesis and NO signaling
MTVDTNRTVRELAVELPYATRIFESLGIDYCCGGKRPLGEACAQSRVAVETVVQQLELAEAGVQDSREARASNWAKESVPGIIDRILKQHHAYVREESPRLQQVFAKVASKHGENHPEVLRARELFDQLAEELAVHLMKEEQILFPYILRMDESQLSKEPMPPSCFGTVRNPIAMMMSEHDGAGELLKQIRKETGDLKAPADACVTFQSLYRDVLAFEADLHQHIHLENNILFPRALAMEGSEKEAY